YVMLNGLFCDILTVVVQLNQKSPSKPCFYKFSRFPVSLAKLIVLNLLIEKFHIKTHFRAGRSTQKQRQRK
ncbi:hypothetical protein, partial [Pseudoalteromonas sp. S2755]|uniref:hypothetical protein n=1 Tax=Pseudoalteromonas sp. S2755 TaxID=2066523 RepID=UPI001BB1919C